MALFRPEEITLYFDGSHGWRKNEEGETVSLTTEELLTVLSPRRPAALILPSAALFSYLIDLPQAKDEEMRQMAGFEARKRLPFLADELQCDFQLLQAHEQRQHLWLFAAPKALLHNELTDGLKPSSFTRMQPSSALLYQGALKQATNTVALWILQVGEAVDFLLLDKERIVAQRSVYLYDTAKEGLGEETRRFLEYLEQQGHPVPEEIFLLASEESGAWDALSAALEIPLRPLGDGLAFLLSEAAAADVHKSVDLRPESFRRHELIQRRIRIWALYILSLSLFVGLLVVLNDVVYRHEKRYLDYVHMETDALGSQATSLSEMMDAILASQKAGRARTRVLNALSDIAAAAPDGILVDYVSFDGGTHSIRLGGQAENRRDLFGFLEALGKLKTVKQVRPIAMPLVTMDVSELIDYQIELALWETE
ncbi:MAG: hypothetical protein GX130_05450 [Candidatus Hydrogenedens sp.]|jgi:hypothetical protein|nr:hypothetical protein [Candidatus Hydrogenedens sp.]